ncbi:MAG TPA: prenyltransferase [Burkholderiaceae bacterium]|nr:prenyltransferase [Burkholderiaceae bacterium]
MNARPSPADVPSLDLAGPGTLRAAKRVLLATRPAFFTASVLPVLVGTAWGFARREQLDGASFALALLATVLAHAAVNVYNDVGDDQIGADEDNSQRIYPYTGGSRFIQCGLLSRAAMARLAAALASGAVIVGAVLAIQHGPAIVLLGAAGLALGILYSMPGIQLSALGVGEAAVGVGLGALPVLGASWLQTKTLNLGAVLISVPVSCWVAAILLINEVPDEASDRRCGKRTLVVRFGPQRTKSIYRGLTGLAFAANLGAVGMGALPWWFLVFATGLAAGGLHAASGVGPASEQRGRLRRSIEQTLAIHALGAIALIAAILIPRALG